MKINCNNDDWTTDIEILPLTQAFPQLQEMLDSDVQGVVPPEVRTFAEKRVVLSKDHDKLFSVVGKKARLIQHTEAVQMVGSAVAELYGDQVECDLLSVKDGAGIRAKFDLSEVIPPLEFVEGDTYKPYLFLSNSYNNMYPFLLRIGLYRSVCMNGSLVGDTVGRVTSKQLLEGWSVEGVVDRIKFLIARLPNIISHWKHWTSIFITFEEAENLISRKFPNKFLENVLVDVDFPMNVYDFYQKLTAEATHGDYSPRVALSFDNVISRLFYGTKSPFLPPETDTNIEEAEDSEIEDSIVVEEDVVVEEAKPAVIEGVFELTNFVDDENPSLEEGSKEE